MINVINMLIDIFNSIKKKRTIKRKRYMSGDFEIHPNALKERDIKQGRIEIW